MGQPALFDFTQHRVAGRIIVLTLHRSLLSTAPLKQVKHVYWIVLVRVSQAHKEKQKTQKINSVIFPNIFSIKLKPL